MFINGRSPKTLALESSKGRLEKKEKSSRIPLQKTQQASWVEQQEATEEFNAWDGTLRLISQIKHKTQFLNVLILNLQQLPFRFNSHF